MNTSHKGRRAEHRARALLEAAGFAVCRAAASKGSADLIAWNSTSIRFISIKSGTKYASANERGALADLPRPVNASVELSHHHPGYLARMPTLRGDSAADLTQ